MIKELQVFELFNNEAERCPKQHENGFEQYVHYTGTVIPHVPKILGFMYNKSVAELKMVYSGESLQQFMSTRVYAAMDVKTRMILIFDMLH